MSLHHLGIYRHWVNVNLGSSLSLFDASSQLYMRVCPSVSMKKKPKVSQENIVEVQILHSANLGLPIFDASSSQLLIYSPQMTILVLNYVVVVPLLASSSLSFISCYSTRLKELGTGREAISLKPL